MASKFPMSPKLNRRNSKSKVSTSSNSIEIPSVISDEELRSMECHFNWDICNLTESTLRERINAVEGHIRENADNILPQSYCLLGYFKSISENKDNDKVLDAFLKAQNSLPAHSTHPSDREWEFGAGYKAVVLCNLATIYLRVDNRVDNREKAEECYKAYREIKETYDLKKHPEILAMKAFALGCSNSNQRFRKSVEAYDQALSHKYYKHRTEWLFGLSHSKSLVANSMEFPIKEDLFDIESILRRVIQLDPNHALAMLRLAKTLIKINGVHSFEETEHWIGKALKTNRSISIIESAGSIYLMNAKEKYGYADKAIKLFEESKKCDENSKNTVLGLGKCYFQKYFEEKNSRYKNNRQRNQGKKKSKNAGVDQIPMELLKAKECFEKIADKGHTECLKLAHIYQEISTYCDKEKYVEQAERIYKEEISKAEQESNRFKKVGAYSRYAIFLNKEKRIVDEIKYLKKAIDVPLDTDTENSEFSFVRECQDKLFKYASKSDGNIAKPIRLKGYIQKQRRNIHSAIFYYEKAIELNDEQDEQSKEDLVDLFIEASQFEYPSNCEEDLRLKYFTQAKNNVEDLPESKRKCELKFKIRIYEIEKELKPYKELNNLMVEKRKYEEFQRDHNKASLEKNVTFAPGTKGLSIEGKEKSEENFNDKEGKFIVDILVESKKVLDRSINIVKKDIFGKSHHTPPHCHYPCPKNLGTNKESIENKMVKLLENKYKLTDFKIKLPDLFDFLVSKQPISGSNDYNWLQKFIDLRNEEEHFTTSIKSLMSKFPKREERISLSREASDYAAEVWKRCEKEVEEYKRRNDVS